MTRCFAEDWVIDPLAAFGRLPDWLAAGMDEQQVADSLVRYLPELSDGHTLVSCTPERLRAKADEWLARYKLVVAGPDGQCRDVVLVGNLWPPTKDVPENGTGSLQVPGARFTLPDLRLQLRVQESDEALPALPTLTEPGPAAELLQPLLRRAGYGNATIATCTPRVVRYKPGSRCTVVVELTYTDGADGPSPVVLKTHEGEKGSTAWAAMTELWARPHAWADAVTLAEPLAFLPEERILVQGPVPERETLKELARRAIAADDPELLDELRGELGKTARALAAVHRSGATYGRTATFADETAEVREVIGRLSLSVPHLEAAAAPLLRCLDEQSALSPEDPIVPAHHDFRPAQVLVHDGQVGFIDFDGASMAEPALDLGRFRAKLRDIGISSLVYTGQPLSGQQLERNLSLMDELCEHFLAAYEEHAPVSRDRVMLWETCDLMTALLHTWTKVRLLRVTPRLTVLLHQLRTAALSPIGP